MQPVQDHRPGAARQADALDDVRDGADLRVVRAVLGHEQHAIVVTDVGSDGDVHVGKTTASSTGTSNRSLNELTPYTYLLVATRTVESDACAEYIEAWRYERCARSSRPTEEEVAVGPPTSSARGARRRRGARNVLAGASGGRTPARMLELFGEEADVPGRPSTSTRPTSASRRVTIRSATSHCSRTPFRWRASTRCRWRKTISPPPWRATKPPCPSVSTSCTSASARRPHGLARPGLRRPQGRDRDIAISREYEGRRRMTLTYPALDRAREVLWVVTGADKREALEQLLPATSRSPPPAYEHSSRR